MNGPGWDWDTPYAMEGYPWQFATSEDPCTSHWQGVNCSIQFAEYHVTELVLRLHALRGSIPATISNLTNLINLDLEENRITGVLPPSIGTIGSLEMLFLTHNKLSGPIPPSFCSLQRLQEVDMYGNEFTGSIPDCIGDLRQLTNLDVSLNHLTGTIPESITQLTQLQVIEAADNALVGSIPHSFGALGHLQYVQLAGNGLDGSIPPSIANLSLLQYFMVAYNRLTGTIPESITQLVSLRSLELHDNFFVGSLPQSVGQLWQLQYLTVGFSHMTGPIPNSIENLTQLLELILCLTHMNGTLPASVGNAVFLTQLLMYHTQLSGTLPDSLGNLTALTALELNHNALRGTLPRSLGRCTKLTYIDLSENRFSGTVPSSFTQMSNLVALNLGYNNLRGFIPTGLGSISALQELNVSYNALTGALPSDLQYLTQLTTLSVQNNRLRGPLVGVFGANQTQLSTIQLDANQFTGELPSVLFDLPSLVALSAVGSCLHGSLPDNICSATSLQALILYGLRTGNACRASDARVLAPLGHTFGGPFPSCLLTLPNLRTLLLASNRLTGAILDDGAVGANLVQLDLSYNLLEGSIPAGVQNHTWAMLDLSHNKLSGVLDTDFLAHNANRSRRATRVLDARTNGSVFRFSFNATAGASLALNTNRLSGGIPDSVSSLADVSVLAGNLFSCDLLYKHDLPKSDSDYTNYECGSNSFNIAIYVWVALVLCAVGVIMGAKYACAEWRFVLPMHYPAETIWKVSHLSALLDRFNFAARMGCCGAAFCVVVLLPYYLVISHFEGTHTHQYAYALSAIYTSGVTAFTVTLALLVMLMLATFVSTARASAPQPAALPISVRTLFAREYFVGAVFAAANITVVLGVNIAFVYIVLYESSEAQTAAQVGMAFFKLAWSMAVSPYMMLKLDMHYLPDRAGHAEPYFTVQLLVALFNNVAIPCLIVMAIDPNCFSDVLLPPAAQNVDFIYPQCIEFVVSRSCTLTGYELSSLQFTPPFSYSNQCSASFITSYSRAFIFMSISTVFVHPALQYGLQQVYARSADDSLLQRALHRSAAWGLSRMLKPLSSEVPAISTLRSRPLVGASATLVTVLTQVGILLTFGAIFPPVAVAMAVSIAAVVYSTRRKMQQFLNAVAEAQLWGYLALVDAECAQVGTSEQIQLAVRVILCFCCAFYTLFLFDTLGDAQGFAASAWVLIVVPLVPVVIFGSEALLADNRGRSDVKQSNLVGAELELVDCVTNNVLHAAEA